MNTKKSFSTMAAMILVAMFFLIGCGGGGSSGSGNPVVVNHSGGDDPPEHPFFETAEEADEVYFAELSGSTPIQKNPFVKIEVYSQNWDNVEVQKEVIYDWYDSVNDILYDQLDDVFVFYEGIKIIHETGATVDVFRYTPSDINKDILMVRTWLSANDPFSYEHIYSFYVDGVYMNDLVLSENDTGISCIYYCGDGVFLIMKGRTTSDREDHRKYQVVDVKEYVIYDCEGEVVEKF